MRGVRALAVALIAIGALVLADAGLTVVWQEPVSALRASIDQSQARAELAAVGHTAGPRGAADGAPIGRIVIPAIGLDAVVVEGTDEASLERGPGHYAGTALPGQPGTVAIAGHRTTYLAPFRDIDELRRGDVVRLVMPYGRFRYDVGRTRIVSPDATWVTRSVGHPRLVLTSCHPLGSASERIVVFAE